MKSIEAKRILESEGLNEQFVTVQTAKEAIEAAEKDAEWRAEVEVEKIRDKFDEAAKRFHNNASGMTLNEYQEKAMTTCLPTSSNDCYMLFGMVEEVGELCGKVSKAIRKRIVDVNGNDVTEHVLVSRKDYEILCEQIKAEAGDVLWMLAGLCRQFRWTLEEVAQYNLDKLAKRKESNTITEHTDH